MKKIIYTLILSFLFIGPACTDLEEEVFDTLTADNFYKNEQELIQAMGNAYTTMQFRGSNLWGVWGATVLSTDEAVAPYRSKGAFLRNNGVFLRTHQHDFLPTIPTVFGSWEFCFNTIASANQIIYQIENAPVESDLKPKFVAELKVLRAYAYYVAMDLFGNIPVTLEFTDTSLPEQKTRAEVFDIIEQELLDNTPLLDETPNAQNYGRCTQAVGYSILAKMYLNAEKWLGQPMWDQAMSMADKVINNGGYSLENDYFANFTIENQTSSETIFAMPYDRLQGWGWMVHSMTLHPAFAEVYNYSAPIWNGVSTTESFYNLYEEEDSRINSWLVGPQSDGNGNPLKDTSGDVLTFTPALDGLQTAGEAQGARMAKWEFTRDLQRQQSMNNDWVFFRLADILLVKAEAQMRKNGGTANAVAVDLVNQVRERAYGNASQNYTIATLTLDELLNERGRELAWEGHRRQDLIRFGKWGEAWFGKPADPGSYTELLPIPSTALAANPNLSQNPGY